MSIHLNDYGQVFMLIVRRFDVCRGRYYTELTNTTASVDVNL